MTPRTKKKRLLKLAAIFDVTPRSKFDQGKFCSSACCVGGHAILALGSKRQIKAFHTHLKGGQEYNKLPEDAQDLLGLTIEERLDLFTPSWPSKFTTRQDNVTPFLAAKRLRHFANTGSLFIEE